MLESTVVGFGELKIDTAERERERDDGRLAASFPSSKSFVLHSVCQTGDANELLSDY